jgi:MarR family transcriptional regulator, organic hydroperoxide resistance regulator
MNSTNNIPLGRLIADVGRLQASRLDQMMDEIGLYRGQAVLLIVLGEADGLTHSEIAETLKISPAAATKVIKRLEELGYLQRRADSSDERISRVFLLEGGRAVLDQIHAVFRRVNRVILNDFTNDEQAQLRGLLTRVYANLQRVPGGGAS